MAAAGCGQPGVSVCVEMRRQAAPQEGAGLQAQTWRSPADRSQVWCEREAGFLIVTREVALAC